MCIKGLKKMSDIHKNKSESVNLKNKHFPIYPNENLFNILRVLETRFSKHDSFPDVFENTYEFFLVFPNLKFFVPFKKKDILTKIFSTCIVLKMR